MEADLALLRHELHAINSQKAWLVPADTAVMRKVDGGTKKGQLVPVSDQARRLARTFFLGIAFRHRWPRFDRLAMRFDDRAGYKLDNQKLWIEPAEHGGLFAWWLHLKPTRAKAPVTSADPRLGPGSGRWPWSGPLSARRAWQDRERLSGRRRQAQGGADARHD